MNDGADIFRGFFNVFRASSLFLYPLKTENQGFSYVFKGYGRRPVASLNEPSFFETF